MDYSAAHSLDRFTAHHDTFEDVLSALMPWAEAFFALVLVALFVFARGTALRAAASFGVAVVAAHFIAVAVDRPRPFVAHAATIHPFLAHAADPGFPSDHATAAFAIAVAVALQRRLLGIALVAVAVLVAAGRVLLGLHYPSDVLAGAILGTASALLVSRPV